MNKYKYHHLGIPTSQSNEKEEYVSDFKMYTWWGDETSEFRTQWVRFDKDSPLHPLIKTVPHVAFKVDDIDEAIKGKKVLLEPCYRAKGLRIAYIEDGGAPIEFIETNWTDEEIIARGKKNKS